MSLTRRQTLKMFGLTAAAHVLPFSFVRPAQARGSEPVLVRLFLRGAADGLSLVVPHGDPTYYSLRPDTQVPAGSELDLDGFYGLHPTLAPLLPHFLSGDLAVVHAVGSHDPSRSHFDAQDFMEYATPGDPFAKPGWLNRYLELAGSGDPFQGITLANAKVKAMAGPAPTVAFEGVVGFELEGRRAAERRSVLETLFATDASPLAASANGLFTAIDTVAGISTETSVVYPATELGTALKDVAAVIRANVGAKVFSVDVEGWDHHNETVPRMAANGSDLAGSLAAFYEDLGSDGSRTLTLAMTEFGRTAAQNGSFGSDHGHGSVMLALGGGVQGGQVLTNGGWPGLAPGDLWDGRDLAVSTDFRDVFAEVLTQHMGLGDVSTVFPGFVSSPTNYPGLYSA